MLDAPEAFFFRCGYDFTIAEQTGCRVAMVGVEAEEKQKGYPSHRGSDLVSRDVAERWKHVLKPSPCEVSRVLRSRRT